MTTTTTKPGIRWMIRKDMPDVLRIEAACFGHSGWTEGDFVKVLRQRDIIAHVVLDGEQVVGYMVYQMQKSCLYLINFAVDPQHQRRGFGRALIEKLKSKINANSVSRNRFTLHVAEHELPLQLFLRACGVRCEESIQDQDGNHILKFVFRRATDANTDNT
jgi:ribosomal-protein-alanine N-acetyltransferase